MFFYLYAVARPRASVPIERPETFRHRQKRVASLIIQLVAYPAIACLYICNSSSQKEKIISSVFLGSLALVVFVLLPISSGRLSLGVSPVFGANAVAISSYCVWKLYPTVQAWLRRWRPAARHAPAAQQQEEEEAGGGGGWRLAHQTTFHIEELPREFSCGEIQAMTQDFRVMVGQGGSIQVFRGLLDDGTAVAVKRITCNHPVGEADFLREISIVASLHHSSLMRLLGYFLLRGGGRCLVYPFFENGSLDSWLFHGGEVRRRLLPWTKRLCIAVDVARALAYLHHECRRQILHLDIKPGNILLDGGLRAHVSDFGISLSVTRDLTSVDTRGRGTFGYMAPAMLINALSTKSDVYSYGMTLLELVGGGRNFEPSSTDSSSATPDFTRDFFPSIAREKMVRGELREVVDAAMALVDEEEVEAVVKVALCCIQHRRDMRPSMLTVVDMLEGRVATDLPSESRLSSIVNFSGKLSSSLTHGR